VSYNVRLKSILQTVTTEFSGVTIKKIKVENHNRTETAVVDNKPYDVRIGRFPCSLIVLTPISQRLIPIDF
jgi:hypothetical protein